ncbi:MAG: adenine-specific DNA-methyltransferase [Candidatus Deianiraeaceae bacterium]|jgi:adenine-specific DNA-methyltransferase
MEKNKMKNAGYSILEGNQNSLEDFLKANYPQVFKDGELNTDELKLLLNIPITTRSRAYGLHFVGKEFALQKYSQESKMELKKNSKLSKNFDDTQNVVIRGDNLDALKILKDHYSNKVKCIYIDPPYNTKSDEFIYSDNFRTHENELLEGYTENEVDRMEGTFKTKQSHSGWLAFMLPRLKLARELLREDGVIFVSIDDNEQANLKLLMDEVFGEENCIGQITIVNNKAGVDYGHISKTHDYIVMYQKSKDSMMFKISNTKKVFDFRDDISGFNLEGLRHNNIVFNKSNRPNLYYPFYVNQNISDDGFYEFSLDKKDGWAEVYPYQTRGIDGVWRWGVDKVKTQNSDIAVKKIGTGEYRVCQKYRSILSPVKSVWDEKEFRTEKGSAMLMELFGNKIFDFSKPVALIKHLLQISTKPDDIVLDFFAGSGTTGQAVMELNHEEIAKGKDGGRKFILVQWSEAIKEGKEAHKFCVENGLEPVISSITVERLRRAGEKYNGVDTGFKVFDCTERTQLVEEGGQLEIKMNGNDDWSKVYNMVLKSGLSLNTEIEEVVKKFIYKAEDRFYVINARDFDTDINEEKVKEMLQMGNNIYIDGWTASINMTLQQYKSNEKMKIVY